MAAVDEAADLVDHAFFDAGVKTAVDAGVPFFTAYQCSDVICVLRQE